MLLKKDDNFISVEEYLETELKRETKHELINGVVHAMAGASANHATIAFNIARKMGNHLEKTPCRIFVADMKVKVGSSLFYPDVLVDCEFDESQTYFTDSPVIIVEVLSKSTRRIDESTKLISYINIPSLQEYVLIEQDYVDIQVIRRSEGWLPRHYFLGDEITFESIDLSLAVEDIYSRVNNSDMIDFLASKG